MSNLNELETAIYTLIQQFIKRQEVVLEAMKDLRPDKVIRARGGDMKRASELTLQFYHERPSPIGYWGTNDEWAFYLHGMGCRLTHTITGEKLEWDVGDLNRFDKNWFLNYVRWLLEQDTTNSAVKIVKSQLKSSSRSEVFRLIFKTIRGINILVEDGSTHRYILIVED